MPLTNAFYDAVNSGNVRRVRIMMKDSLLVDTTFAEFAEMEKAASAMDGLYEAHDGRELISDRTQWNDEYMSRIMVQAVSNFSHERVAHLKDVVRYLRPAANTAAAATKTSSASAKATPTGAPSKSSDAGSGIKIVAGAAVGAVVGGVVASVAGITVIGGTVTGAVVGGAAVAVALIGGKD